MQLSKSPLNQIRFILRVKSITQKCVIAAPYTTTVDAFDLFTSEVFHKRHRWAQKNHVKMNIRSYTDNDDSDVSQMSMEKLDATFHELLSKSKDKQILQMIQDCVHYKKFLPIMTLKKLFRNYSMLGRPDYVILLQEYCAKVDPIVFKRNGEFLHYLAKAQCMKGNSDKGLSILQDVYLKNTGLRSLYRIIFKELIQDSVLNRSEATLVIFKKYVLYFSSEFEDHYPIICFWHICWSSSWFSDQVLSEELFDSSEELQEIVREKATAFSICILRDDHNEDAVVRLLQTLLKYTMMTEYVKVLQILFNYKLKNRDMRGCAEILRNCEALGVTLPSSQQGKYIKMLIEGKSPKLSEKRPEDFKLKF